MPNQTKQRFIDLDVAEVSLVDSPANEQEFIVVKCLNEQEVGEMAENNTEVQKNEDGVAEPQATESAPEKVSVEVEKAANAAVEKVMDQVATMVENIAKSTGAEANKDSGESEVETEKGKKPNMRAFYMKQLEKAGIKGTALETAMKEYDKEAAKMPGETPLGATAKPPIKKEDTVQKNEEGADDEADVNKALEALAIGVEKAKAFTPKRQEALKAAIETLNGLLKEMMPKQIPQGGSPKTTVPESPKYGESSVVVLTKAIEGLKEVFETRMSEVQDVNKSLNERLEAIEKTRSPSTSVEAEGGTDKQQEVEKSIWAGVL